VSGDAARALAARAAEGLGTRISRPLEPAGVAGTLAGAAPFADREFPAVIVDADPLTVLLAPADALALAALLDPAFAGEELTDAALAALADALGDALGAEAAPAARLADDAGDVRAIEPDALLCTCTLTGEELSLALVIAAPPVAEPAPVTASGDADAPAIARIAGLAARAAEDVLANLFADELTVTSGPVASAPADVISDLEFPAIAGEVVVGGAVEGSAWVALAPGDAATLAAAMMGTPETVGDGLSAIELSAVSEALNQLLTATAAALADAVGAAVEIASPSCAAVPDAAGLRRRAGEIAHAVRLQIVSERFSGTISLLVAPELATALEAALADVPAAAFDPDPFADLLASLGAENVAALAAEHRASGPRELLSDVKVRVSAEFGRAKLPIGRIANLPAGAVVPLDREPGDAVDVLVNGTPFAQARVVLVDGEYAVQIVSLTPAARD
jgi:flagellar motor switch protein FliN/FliY